MKNRSTVESVMLSTAMVLSSLFLLSSLVLALIPNLQLFGILQNIYLPGAFLLNSFSIMAFYPVLYLLYNGILIGQNKDTQISLVVSSLLFLPMISLSALLRLIFDSSFQSTVVGSWMVESFTISGSIPITAGISIVLMLLLFRLGLSGNPTTLEGDSPPNPPPPRQKTLPLLLQKPTENQDQILSKNQNIPEVEEEDIVQIIREKISAGMSETEPIPRSNSFDKSLHSFLNTGMRSFVASHEVQEANPDNALEVDDALEAYVDLDPVDFFPSDTDNNAEFIDDTTDSSDTPSQYEDERYEDDRYNDNRYDQFLDIDKDDPHPLVEDSPVARDGGFDRGDQKDYLDEPQSISEELEYRVPIHGVLNNPSSEPYWEIDDDTNKKANLLRNTLSEFGIEAEVTGIRKGPVVTMFEILPAPGVKLSRIVNLVDNIALSLAAATVRIIAPVPGKHAVGIEVPNKTRHLVTFSEILQEDTFKKNHLLPVTLGKDITGESQIIDLTRTPHILIAGATGAGKSVCVNSFIASLLYSRDPKEVKMILIDPKIVELKFYNDIPHLLTPVITNPKYAFQALKWCLSEMERRYSLLDSKGVRDIESFNRKVKESDSPILPYIVVVVDEFADLMATSGKELESVLARLAAMSRAVGIHLVLATQRPSTDVITGLIKANIPSRIAFMVASKVDSRIIIDSVGAEKLLGKGDMLFTSAWDPFPKRIQGTFLSESEIERIVSHVKTLGSPQYIDDEIFSDDDETYDNLDSDDPLLQDAIDIVYSAKKASASYLQRRLSIGYNRASRLIEVMESMGIVGAAQGSKPREIL